MGGFQDFFFNVAAYVSKLLDPLAAGLERLHFAIGQQLRSLGVPFDWQERIILAAWVIVLLLLLRVFGGWLRVIYLVCLAVILAKVFDYLPPG